MYLQVGAMMGTIMAWNVFFVIIPSQRKLVEAKERGVAPDPVYGLRGKQRSVHNNYFTLPVLFIMISNHYPMTFGHRHAWLVLIAMLLLAAYVRHFFNLRHKGRTVWAIPVSAALATLVLAVVIAPAKPKAAAYSFADVQKIVAERCATCHAAKPTQPGFNEAPKGVLLDTPAQIVANAQKINEQCRDQGDADRQPHRHDRRRARHARRVDRGGGAAKIKRYGSSTMPWAANSASRSSHWLPVEVVVERPDIGAGHAHELPQARGALAAQELEDRILVVVAARTGEHVGGQAGGRT